MKPLIVVDKSEHSELGASGASRWMNCPGSIALCKGLEGGTSEYAMLGTAAHALGEYVYNVFSVAKAAGNTVGLDILELLYNTHGKLIQVEEEAPDLPSSVKQYKDFIIDANMRAAVAYYLTEILKRSSLKIAPEVSIERSFDLSEFMGAGVDVFGMADCAIAAHSIGLQVLDYKHGEGVPVYARENAQQMFYAFGYILDLRRVLGLTFEEIKTHYPSTDLVIVQPRCRAKKDPIDSWTLPTGDLINWGMTVLKPAVQATQKPNAPLKNGKWCMWCKAKKAGTCTEYGKEDIGLVFPPAANAQEDSEVMFNLAELLTQDPKSMEPIGVVKVLGAIAAAKPKINRVLKMMEAFSKKALKRVQEAKDIPGYVAAPGKNSYKWRDEEDTLAGLKQFFPDMEFELKGMKSVAQVKTLLKGAKVNPASLLSGDILTVSGKPTLKKAQTPDEVFGNLK